MPFCRKYQKRIQSMIRAVNIIKMLGNLPEFKELPKALGP